MKQDRAAGVQWERSRKGRCGLRVRRWRTPQGCFFSGCLRMATESSGLPFQVFYGAALRSSTGIECLILILFSFDSILNCVYPVHSCASLVFPFGKSTPGMGYGDHSWVSNRHPCTGKPSFTICQTPAISKVYTVLGAKAWHPYSRFSRTGLTVKGPLTVF